MGNGTQRGTAQGHTANLWLGVAPSSGKGPRGRPSCSSRCGWRPLGEGKQGSLAPQLLASASDDEITSEILQTGGEPCSRVAGVVWIRILVESCIFISASDASEPHVLEQEAGRALRH